MDLETSKKILKIFGILDIIFGIIGIIVGLLAFAGGGLVAASDQSEAGAIGAGIAVILGVILVISGIVSLLQGIFSVRAAKDTSKIMPAWIFALIGVVMAAISLIGSFGGEASGIISGITLVFLPAVSSFVIPKMLGGGDYVLVGNLIEM